MTGGIVLKFIQVKKGAFVKCSAFKRGGIITDIEMEILCFPIYKYYLNWQFIQITVYLSDDPEQQIASEYLPTPVVILDLLSVATPIGSKVGNLFMLDLGCFFILSSSRW